MTTTTTNTIRLHRVLRAAPEKIYRAFLDADAMAKWLPPNGFTGKVHQMEAKVGGTYKMSFTNFTTGNSHSAHAHNEMEFRSHLRNSHDDRDRVAGCPDRTLRFCETASARDAVCVRHHLNRRLRIAPHLYARRP